MENQLAIIVKESGLEKTKSQALLDQFSDYFQIASEWEKKASMIVVADASQVSDMKMARIGRLFLREKRIAIERTRKQLKEQALREGKAIDGIANILKALIVPIEEYLEKQEKFIEIKAAEEAERARIEAEKKAEEERIAKEKAEAAERERIRKENERVKKEAEEKERAMAAERAKAKAEAEKQRAIFAEQKAKAEAERKKREAERIAYEKKVQAEKEEADRKARAEKEMQAKIIAEQKAKAEVEKERQERIIAELKAKADAEKVRLKKEKETAEKAAKTRLDSMIKCPFCHKSFTLKDCKKTYVSEVEEDPMAQAKRQEEFSN